MRRRTAATGEATPGVVRRCGQCSRAHGSPVTSRAPSAPQRSTAVGARWRAGVAHGPRRCSPAAGRSAEGLAHPPGRAPGGGVWGLASRTLGRRGVQQRCAATRGGGSARAVQRPRWPSARGQRHGFRLRAGVTHGAPGCRRLPLAALHRPHALLARREGADQHPEGGLGGFAAGCDLPAISPPGHDLPLVPPPPEPYRADSADRRRGRDADSLRQLDGYCLRTCRRVAHFANRRP